MSSTTLMTMLNNFKQTLLILALSATLCSGDGNTNTSATNATLPLDVGVVLFPAFEILDLSGPLSAFNMLSLQHPMNLHLISPTLDPVPIKPRSSAMNPFNSNFSLSINPTHNFTYLPTNIDVLLIPGGMGTRAPDLEPTISFIRDTYPRLQYLLSVCTGSWLAARAGVLDDRNATSNKRAWAGREGLGNSTNWITHARWVVDGNVWTSSGVTAGTDAALAWIAEIYGNETATEISNGVEHRRGLESTNDPFAEIYGL
ncbi:hypothetical protein PQX77_011932 [Marasmius sp. AFHP31]|nr:hypothetical protein PQX77_011932 [Marasmius sp. AFHP31]